MIKLATVLTIGLAALVLAMPGPVQAGPGGVASTVESVLITESGTPIGSLRNPQPGARLGVDVQAGDHQLQAIVRLSAAPGERFLLLTDLEDVVISALTEEGVVGSVLAGGWSLDPRKEQTIHINIAGRRPAEADEFDLLQALVITEGRMRAEFRVEARVMRPAIPVPGHLITGGVGAGAAVAVALALVVWSRSRRGPNTNWSY